MPVEGPFDHSARRTSDSSGHAGRPQREEQALAASWLALKEEIAAYPVDDILNTGARLKIGKDERFGTTH